MKLKQNHIIPTDINCPICQSDTVFKIYEFFPSYVENTFYDIYKCNSCETQFILGENTPSKLYEAIYRLDDTPGYDRYKNYAKVIKGVLNPLKFLSEQEFAYYAVHEYLKTVKKTSIKSLKILEIGSGLGYLTYAVNKFGYSTLGIDISKVATDNAKKQFGDYYLNSSIEKLVNYKADLIIATELVEHLDDPINFIKNCLNSLDNDGVILLTTPNYYIKNEIWGTDLPPIHRFWFSKKSFEVIARNFNLYHKFMSLSEYNPKNENLLINLLMTHLRGDKLPSPVFSENLTHVLKGNSHSSLRAMTRKILLSIPIRHLSNLCFKLVSDQYNSFSILLKKSEDFE